MQERKNILPYIIAVVSIFIFALFYFLLPYYYWGISNLDDGKNYFTSINAYATFLIGVLGAFYYFDKKAKDIYDKERDLRRQHIQILLTELKEYDKLVESILCKEIKSESNLQSTRRKIQKSFDDIIIIAENNGKILSFKMEDLITIVKVNSFIEKNDLIMHKSFTKLKKIDLSSQRDEYIGLIKKAKQLCHLKIQ